MVPCSPNHFAAGTAKTMAKAVIVRYDQKMGAVNSNACNLGAQRTANKDEHVHQRIEAQDRTVLSHLRSVNEAKPKRPAAAPIMAAYRSVSPPHLTRMKRV